MRPTHRLNTIRITSNPAVTTVLDAGTERVFVNQERTDLYIRYEPVVTMRASPTHRWSLFRDGNPASLATDLSRELVIRNNVTTILSLDAPNETSESSAPAESSSPSDSTASESTT